MSQECPVTDITDIATIADIAMDIADIVDIVTDIAAITDIVADIASIADITNIVDIADRMLWILWRCIQGVTKVFYDSTPLLNSSSCKMGS